MNPGDILKLRIDCSKCDLVVDHHVPMRHRWHRGSWFRRLSEGQRNLLWGVVFVVTIVRN